MKIGRSWEEVKGEALTKENQGKDNPSMRFAYSGLLGGLLYEFWPPNKKGRTLRKPGDQGLTQIFCGSGPYSDGLCDRVLFSSIRSVSQVEFQSLKIFSTHKAGQPDHRGPKVKNVFFNRLEKIKTRPCKSTHLKIP